VLKEAVLTVNTKVVNLIRDLSDVDYFKKIRLAFCGRGRIKGSYIDGKFKKRIKSMLGEKK
jgi:hypothetical protein